MTIAVEEKATKETPERLFDAQRDSRLITQGSHFFCHACLVARPVESRSADSRYCQQCCDFLTAEGAILQRGTRRPSWLPCGGGMGGQNNTGSRNSVSFLAAPKKRGRRAVELPGAVITGLIADGIPRKEVAARMGVSERTLRRKIKGGVI